MSTITSSAADIPPDFTNRPIQPFDGDIPNDFLMHTVELLFGVYGARDKSLTQFPKTEQHDLWPMHRRSMFERDWRELARMHGLSGVAVLNKSLNAFHTTVSGGIVVMTQSYVEDRRDLPRYAEFRNTLTKSSQFMMFANPEVPDPSARIYAILTHGQYADDSLQPGWADVVFPAMEGQKVVVVERIRLFEDRYPTLVSQLRAQHQPATADTEQVPDNANPKLRAQEETGE
jgi:hypothetical protein